MTDFIKNCLHCGTSMQTQRRTKKYCSDTCKQAAFYSRGAQPSNALNGSEPLTAIELDGEDTDEEQIDRSNNVERESFNDEQLPDKIPFNVRNPTNQQTIPEPYNAKRREEDKTKGNSKRFDDTEVEEKPYDWVRSELIDEIADYVQDNYKTSEMFQYPKKYWYGSDLEKVKWVSVRFLCIIENLLHFDNSIVERKTLITINKALIAMMDAWNFKYMPHNYPLKNEIKAQQQRIEKIISVCDKSIRLGFKRDTKVKLIALRFQLADLVPKVRFHNLDFSK